MSKSEGTKVCKHCKSEIPAGAKICPQCRKKQGGIGKWILIVVVILIIGAAAASGGNSDDSQSANSKNANTSEGGKDSSSENNSVENEKEEKIEYISVSAQDLIDALEKNAMKASDAYKGKYLKIKGELGNVDSDGKYIGITTDEITLANIQCYITSDDQKDIIMEKTTGDEITVKGYCKDVGEILGYSIDIDSVK